MTFIYQWANRQSGRYAIRKTGKESGKEIERKDKQTTGTHHFLSIADDDLYKIRRINETLKTITLNFVNAKSGKKSIRQYLSKNDIDGIFKNIGTLKNKELTIEIQPAGIERSAKAKLVKQNIDGTKNKFEKLFGKDLYNKLLSLVKTYIEKEREIAKTIKALEKEKENITDRFYNSIFLKYNKRLDTSEIKQLIDWFSEIEKWELKREKQNEIQKNYREREKIKAGTQNRKRGRPKKLMNNFNPRKQPKLKR